MQLLVNLLKFVLILSGSTLPCHSLGDIPQSGSTSQQRLKPGTPYKTYSWNLGRWFSSRDKTDCRVWRVVPISSSGELLTASEILIPTAILPEEPMRAQHRWSVYMICIINIFVISIPFMLCSKLTAIPAFQPTLRISLLSFPVQNTSPALARGLAGVCAVPFQFHVSTGMSERDVVNDVKRRQSWPRPKDVYRPTWKTHSVSWLFPKVQLGSYRTIWQATLVMHRYKKNGSVVNPA